MQTATISKAIFKFRSKFYIQNLWHSFIRDNSFLQTPTKSPCPHFLLPPLSKTTKSIRNISSLASQLHSVRHEIFQLCRCWYIIIQIAFSEKFLTYPWSAQLINQVFKYFGAFIHLEFHCFILLLNFITSRYSFFRRII